MAGRNNRYQFDPASGGVIDWTTGTLIRPGDENWNPEWTQVMQTNASIPSGEHLVFPNGYNAQAPGAGDTSMAGLMAAGGQLQRNDVPWYEDPALLGAIGLPFAAGALGAFAAPATSDFAVTSTPLATGGMANTAGNAAAGVAGTAGGAASGAASGVSNVSTLTKLADALRGGGVAVGGATNAAANNRSQQLEANLQANGQNIAGESAFINELLGMAGEEDKQRSNAYRDIYKSSYAQNPSVSPFDPTGGPKFSPQLKSTLNTLAGQGQDMLSKPATYQVSNLPKPTPYTPLNASNLPGYNPSTMESIGDWVGPGLMGASTMLKLFGLGG